MKTPMTCAQVRTLIDRYLAAGGTVLNDDRGDVFRVRFVSPILGVGDPLLKLGGKSILDQTSIGDSSDDMFLMPDGSIDYHTPKGRPDKQGTITFMPIPLLASPHLEVAIRMAIGNTRTNRWKNLERNYTDPIGNLFLVLDPAEQAVVRAWEVILSAAPEPLICDEGEIWRKGTDKVDDAAPTVPALVAGFLSYVAREVEWDMPAKLHAILYPEPLSAAAAPSETNLNP